MRVWLSIKPEQADRTTGIGQVVQAQYKLLPKYGVEITEDPARADVIACHIAKADQLPRIDVLHCHGLYFSDVPHEPYIGWHGVANKSIVEAARRAALITVPAAWVAEPFRRDMRIQPEIVPHGIDPGEFGPGNNQGYILYNKNRESDVCTSKWALELARANFRVVSTMLPRNTGNIPGTMTVTGLIPFDKMVGALSEADIYLATTLETFGIGTLEAMASGVPVLGFNWGGNSDIVTHKLNGYLVEPGDLEGLKEGVAYIRQHRAEMSKAAMEAARKYTWDSVMRQYAEIYQRAFDMREDKASGIGLELPAIVITNHNYAQWVGEAIESAVNQTLPPSQVIVVDDKSTDTSLEVIREKAGKYPDIVKLVAFDQNRGVAAARNAGIAQARSRYIALLDADDRLNPKFLQATFPVLREDRGLGIVYTGLGIINDKGQVSGQTDWPPEFDWELQATPNIPPMNCIPSGCLFRKAMWERAGWIKQEYAPGEDTEFWTRGLSVGFLAKKVTPDPLFEYRIHEGSASRTRKYIAIDDRLPWMRSKEYPMAAPTKRPPTVRAYSKPDATIIIPVGPGHEGYIPSALDSILGQTWYSWEVILIDDTRGSGRIAPLLKPYPFTRLIVNNGPRHGAGVARNLGIKAARGEFVIFLDADDYLAPTALEEMLLAYDGNYVYTDYVAVSMDGTNKIHEAMEPDQNRWQMYHPVTVLLKTVVARNLLFDETLPSWEDHDFFLKAAINGVCGKRIPKPLLYYRLEAGTRRLTSINKDGTLKAEGEKILAEFQKRYGAYFDGGKKMSGCSSCGGSEAAKRILAAKGMGGINDPGNQSNPPVDRVRMEFIGERVGAVSYNTPNGHSYRAGNNPMEKYIDVDPADVAYLERTSFFKVIYVPRELANPTPPQPQVTQAPQFAEAAPAPTGRPVDIKPETVQTAEQARQAAEKTLLAARQEMEALEDKNGAAEEARWKAVEERMARERLNQKPPAGQEEEEPKQVIKRPRKAQG